MLRVHIGPAWFLMVLFGNRILMGLYEKKGVPQVVKVLLVLGASFVSVYVGDKIKLPFSLLPALVTFPFFVLGYHCGKALGREGTIHPIVSMSLAAVSLALLLAVQSRVTGTLMLISNVYPDGYFLTMAGGIAGCALFFRFLNCWRAYRPLGEFSRV